jgi:hypothetical protein
MLVIGSKALYHWYGGQIGRKPKDTDVICTKEEMNIWAETEKVKLQERSNGKFSGLSLWNGPFEFELTEESESAKMYYELQVLEELNNDINYASTAILFSIKSSHINYPRFWEKHIRDFHLLKNTFNGVDSLCDITKLRRKETEVRYGKLKTPSLNKTKNDFFDDNVSNRTFIHDDIHNVMAHKEKPMFEYIKLDPNQVACSKDKFFNSLTAEERIQCVLEEAYVIALERCIIPMLYEGKRYISAKNAFDWAVMRICTTLCSGWFRKFAVENWPAIQLAYDNSFDKRFLQAVDSKTIKRKIECI